jgi:hypothetical protein
LKSNFTAAR